MFQSPLFKPEFCSKEHLIRMNPYLRDEESYLKVQREVRKNAADKFIHSDITDIPEKYSDSNFNYVMLSNIMQYHQSIAGLKTPYDINRFIQRLSKIVAEEGLIYVNYTYLIQTYCALDSPEIQKLILTGQLNRQQLKLFKGPESTLLEKYPEEYSFETFNAVEPTIREKNDFRANGILTFAKRKKSSS